MITIPCSHNLHLFLVVIGHRLSKKLNGILRLKSIKEARCSEKARKNITMYKRPNDRSLKTRFILDHSYKAPYSNHPLSQAPGVQFSMRDVITERIALWSPVPETAIETETIQLRSTRGISSSVTTFSCKCGLELR